MKSMRAVVYDRYGPADVLHVDTVPMPLQRSGEVLIRVRGASVNGIDLIVRSGKLKLFTGRSFPRRVGLDFAGEVVTADATSTDLKAGDHVWGLVPEKTFGSLAEFVSVPSSLVSKSPQGLSRLEAAALPVVGSTALIALTKIAKLQKGERLLIRGAAGSVGSAAVQLGRGLGAQVTTIASAASSDYLLGLGANNVLDRSIVRAETLGTFDVILDTVGSNTSFFRRLLRPGGRMMTICPDPRHPIASMAYVGFSWIYGARRVRFFSARPNAGLLAELASCVERGVVRPIVDSVYPLERSADATRAMESGGRRGKQIIDVEGH